MKKISSNIFIGAVTSVAMTMMSGCCSVQTGPSDDCIVDDGSTTLTCSQFFTLVKDLPPGCKELYEVAPGHGAETEKNRDLASGFEWGPRG